MIQVKVKDKDQGDKTVDLKDGANGFDLLSGLKIYADSALVLLSGRPIPLDQVLEDGSEIEVIVVASGG